MIPRLLPVSGFPLFALLLATLSPAGRSACAAEGVPADGELLWPTDAGRCVTSTFCEFRADHFHSGLDISTWGKVGYRCFALADGEIYRARVSCGGYGRAVYVRLADGRTVVYAHLSRFAGALEDSVRAIQESAGSAYFDREFPAGTFPVRRGDVVAFTGQSGVGVPHLHVEVRDAAERPLDPLRNGLLARDTSPPWVACVSLTPLTPASSVDGRTATLLLDVHPAEARAKGRIPRVIPVEGDVGLAVEVDETADACRFRLAASRLELREGEDLRYAVDYDGFAFPETGHLDLQIDPRFSYPDVGQFHLLYRSPGYDLPFPRDGSSPDGVVRGDDGVPETLRTLEVRALDAAGNAGTVQLTLSFAAPPEVRALSARVARAARPDSIEAALDATWNDVVEVDGAIARGGREVVDVDLDWSPDGGRTWIDGIRTPIHPDDSFHASVPLGSRIPGAGREGVVVRAVVRDVLGASSVPRAIALGEGDAPAAVAPTAEVVTRGRWTEVHIDESFPWGAMAGGEEGARSGRTGEASDEPSMVPVLVRPDGRGVRIVVPARAGGGGRRDWSGIGEAGSGLDAWGRPVPLAFDVPPTFQPGRSRMITSPDGRASYALDPDSFREPCALVIREGPPSAPAPGELRSLGPLYSLESGSVAPIARWRITLDAALPPENAARVGIFVQERGRFRYIGGRDAQDGARWSTDSRTLLGVGLFEDARPPTLGAPRLEVRHGRTRLLFHADDSGSGIDCDDVEVLFDGRPIVHELDDETGDVVAYPPLPTTAGGGGTFEMRVLDRCGNAARRVERVTLN
jgi:hypothetical protein